MDVRCEKCQTEYELDESKLKPGGVTVKCTTCGHMFRVRRRGATAQGIGDEGRSPAALPDSELGLDDPPGDRTWLVRLDDGEIKTCRELATLQRWIVGGVLSRTCTISRTGRKWKRLGEIADLASYFTIAEEARSARASVPPDDATRQYAPGAPLPPGAAGVHPRAVPRKSDPVPEPAVLNTTLKMGSPIPVGKIGGAPGTRRGGSSSVKFEPGDMATAHYPPLAPPELPTVEQPPSAELVAAAAAEGIEVKRLPIGGRLTPPPPLGRPTGPWAAQAQAQAPVFSGSTTGRSGPTGGRLHADTGQEAAFVGGNKLRDIRGEYENGAFVPSDADDVPPRSRAPLWIVLGSLALLGTAAVVIMIVTRADRESRAVAVFDAGAAGAPLDAGTGAAVAMADAGVARAAAGSLLAGLDALLAADRAAALSERLGALDGAGLEGDPGALVARARLENALAQHDVDRAALAETPGQGKPLLVEAKSRAARARGLADRALAVDKLSTGGMLAMADARRLEGERAIEVERWLKSAQAAGADAAEAARILAALRQRDGRTSDARAALLRLRGGAAGGSDIRIAIRLALLDLAEGKAEPARAALEGVLAGGEHAVATAAVARLAPLPMVDGSDPMPPEVKPAPRPEREPSPTPSPGGEGYDALLRRADKLAESGQCSQAIALYRDAIDHRPAGVEALTGLGYCHLDGRDYASAFAKFRAALGISPRYQEAMWGIAEMYQRQGLKAQAIERYRAFLREHPGSARAANARRQIESLGGTVEETPPEPAPSEPTPSEPTPTPVPEPAPAAPTP